MVACRMKEIANTHQAVLMREVLHHLKIKSNGIYVDATFGRGGHSQAILAQLGPHGKLLVMDKDPDAIQHAQQSFLNDPRVRIHHGSFTQLESILKTHNIFGQVDGILFDLGVSSPQLDQSDRGFSFLRAGPLDMRMDYSRGIDASTWLAEVKEEDLANILFEYGEERYSRRIAKAIITARQASPITTTDQLANIIAAAHPNWQVGRHPATRSFQAIRIFINQELTELQIVLKQALDALKNEGRLLVISFHSLEDRIVKHFMQQKEEKNRIPAKLPIKGIAALTKLKAIGSAVKPSEDEIALNPRARSAVLRVGEKLS